MDCKWKLARILSSSFPTFPNLLPWLWWETPMYGFQWWEDAYNRSGRQVHNPIIYNCTIRKVGLNTERMTQLWETIPGHIHSMENPLIQYHWISFGNFCDIITNFEFKIQKFKIQNLESCQVKALSSKEHQGTTKSTTDVMEYWNSSVILNPKLWLILFYRGNILMGDYI